MFNIISFPFFVFNVQTYLFSLAFCAQLRAFRTAVNTFLQYHFERPAWRTLTLCRSPRKAIKHPVAAPFWEARMDDNYAAQTTQDSDQNLSTAPPWEARGEDSYIIQNKRAINSLLQHRPRRPEWTTFAQLRRDMVTISVLENPAIHGARCQAHSSYCVLKSFVRGFKVSRS